jgi:hypothetical protein
MVLEAYLVEVGHQTLQEQVAYQSRERILVALRSLLAMAAVEKAGQRAVQRVALKA